MVKTHEYCPINPLEQTKTFSLSPSRTMQDAGVVLDIDGVLKRGKTKIEGAKEALLLLQENNINYAMVTNGGGTRKKKADFVTNLLGVDVSEEQMIVSHTPLILLDVMNSYEGYVFVIGKTAKEADAVVKEHGWDPSRVLVLQRLSAACQTLFPRGWYCRGGMQEEGARVTTCGEVENDKWENERAYVKNPSPPPIGCIVAFDEPHEWGEGVQLLLDVLLAEGGKKRGREEGGKNGRDREIFGERVHKEEGFKQLPVFVCNPDFDYQDRCGTVRLTAGAFAECAKALYQKETGKELEVTWMGKPTTHTSQYASQLLGSPKRIFAVGDNPKSDIRGARRAGWTGILVCTGCYRPSGEEEGELGNDENDPADFVCRDVLEAVEWIVGQCKS